MDTSDRHPDRLLALIQELRDTMTAQLDILTSAVREAAPPAPSRQRRRISYGAKIIPTDIDKAKARAALARMGIKP